MARSILWYLKEFLRRDWLHRFFFAKTAPLVTPPHFRDFPALTERECTHCLSCMMICPAPGAIEVTKTENGWEPRISPGHCIRCGLCVEVCPEDVLASGRILEVRRRDRSGYRARFHIHVDPERCMKCGNCVVSCPINKEIDPEIAYGGHSASDEVIMRIEKGRHCILHAEKTTGCKTCENTCPNGAIRVERILEPVQEGPEPCGSC